MEEVRWLGSKVTSCHFCGKDLLDSFIDGKTRRGQWGIMCPECHQEYGVGLGTGKGQKYENKGDEASGDVWIKTEG